MTTSCLLLTLLSVYLSVATAFRSSGGLPSSTQKYPPVADLKAELAKSVRPTTALSLDESNAGLLRSAGMLSEVNGGLLLRANTGVPSCDASLRGTIWFAQSDNSAADQLLVCMQDANKTMTWQALQI